jgi:hypothetical protein
MSGEMLRKTGTVVMACLAFAVARTALAQTAVISPGEYLMDGDSGKFVVTKTKTGSTEFKFYSESGAPGYACRFEGTILNGHARLEADDDGPDCDVTFKATGNYIEVTHNEAPSCRSYCGSNADFDNLLFHRAKPECSRQMQAKSRNEFKGLYSIKSFGAARAVLESLLARCEGAMRQTDVWWVRNDLALAQYWSGDAAACLETLRPMADVAATSDEDVRREYSSVADENGDSYLPAIRAIRTNLVLCRGKDKK